MRRFYVLGILGLAASGPLVFAAVRRSSVVQITAGTNVQSSFCTVDGKITVAHSCQGKDAFSDCSGGVTLLEGPSTQRLGPGTHSIPSGCYTHKLASAGVGGSAILTSSVWYNSKD